MIKKQTGPSVNLHHSILFLPKESISAGIEVEGPEDAVQKEPKTLDDMLGLLRSEPSLVVTESVGMLEAGPEDFTLDSQLKVKKPPEKLVQKPLWRKDPFEGIEKYLPPGLNPPRTKVVRQYDLSDDDLSTISDEPKRKTWKIPTRLRHPDVNMYSKDYWLARKKVKNLRVGNDLAVISTLNVMTKMDFTNKNFLYGIVDSGGMETLLNLLDYKGDKTELNSLKLLNKMADDEIVKGLMVNQGIPDSCFRLLFHSCSDIVLEASNIIFKLCSLTCMRAYCRKSKALEILLEFAETKDKRWLMDKQPPKLTGQSKDMFKVAVNCLKALNLLYSSRAVRRSLYQLGFLQLLRRLMNSKNDDFYRIGIRMVTLAASIKEYVEVYIEEGLMEFVYKKYTSKEPSIHLETLKAIYKCINNAKCKHWMLERGFFKFLIEEFETKGSKELKYTMMCIVKFINNEKYRNKLDQCNPITKLYTLFDYPSPKIRDCAGYMMGQLSRYPKNFSEIAGAQNLGVMKLLKYVQTLSDYTLVAHIYKVICDLSFDDKIYWDICDVTDPIGILWGAVTADHPKVHEYGCSALVPYIGPMPDSVERVLRFPGALHDLLRITHHEDDGAKAGAVTLLARFCQMEYLFDALIEEGFDKRILELAKTATHPRLRYAIGYGLGSCARTAKMSFSLGKRGAVDYLLDWLVNDKDQYAQLGIVTGLWKLSYEPINCKSIIEAKVVERLTYLTAGKNECLQNSLAGLLSNMRHLARSAECLKYKQRPHPPEPKRGVASDPDIIHPFQYADDPVDAPV